MPDLISEKLVEDILAADRPLLAELLTLDPAELDLIARQRPLPSGRLDLLCLCGKDILLIELKVVPFYAAIVTQVENYYQDLRDLQERHRLVHGEIRKIVLVTAFSPEDAAMCARRGIELHAYDPKLVLSVYYEHLKGLSYFLEIESADYGVVRLGLLQSTLGLVSEGRSIADITSAEGRSIKTIRNRLAVASQLGLVARHLGDYFVTEFGGQFLAAEHPILGDRLSDEQVNLLSAFVAENPFYSSVTYTILAFTESVFVLAKGAYPVPRDQVQDYFVRSVGKTTTWKTDKARRTASYIFSNYACELGFLAYIEDCFYLAPKGIRAILVLQLNRSIKLIESQR